MVCSQQLLLDQRRLLLGLREEQTVELIAGVLLLRHFLASGVKALYFIMLLEKLIILLVSMPC